MSPKPLSLRTYLLIAFAEGGAVMACELLGAKMIAPFYGSSLLVWSSVIGITLAALSCGYFAGGYLVDRFTDRLLLFRVLGIGAAFVAIMPLTSQLIMDATLELGIRTGSLVSTLVFLFPPLVCMGMVSPIIIRLASQDLQHTGRTAGSVYATSTFGGILSTFLVGFYGIPTWGITRPTFATAVLLGVFPIVFFLSQKRVVSGVGLLAILGGTLALLHSEKADARVIYQSEGLLGQVIVSDQEGIIEDVTYRNRVLFVNRLPQTNQDLVTGYSFWPYVHAASTMASIKPAGSKALVLGSGGGSVADEFIRLGFQVEGCELDIRIVDVAKEYFHPDQEYPNHVDDARHFIRTTGNTYDIVMFDVFAGEHQPPHVLTLESFEELKRILNLGGLVIINSHGFISGENGLGSRSIVKTLFEAGFDVRVLTTPGTPEERNILYVASPQPLDFSGLDTLRQNACCRHFGNVPIPLPFTPTAIIPLTDAYVLQDNQPILELLNVPVNEAWRRLTIGWYDQQFHGSAFY